MNKKFSTLLAAFLVAGGLGSSAFATDYPINQYVQLKMNSKPLIVGESAVRDSLAFVKSGYEGDLYSFNQSLWRLVVEEKKGSNGLLESYNVYLENKVNGAVSLTKADADAKKSLYYAPGAVVSSSKFLLANVKIADVKEVEENGVKVKKVTIPDAKVLNVPFTSTAIYDAASKSLKYYYLKETNGVIKLMLETKSLSDDDVKTEASLTSAKNTFNSDCANLADKISIETVSANLFSLSVNGLNNIGNDAFNLTFTEDISSNAQFANPFTASSLHASTYTAYMAATYDTKTNGYEAALKAANDEVAALKQLKTDVASFVKEMKVAIDYDSSEEGAFVVTTTSFDPENAGDIVLDKEKSKAPNAEDIYLVTPENSLLKSSTEEESLYAQIQALANLSTTTKYEKVGLNEEIGVKDANKLVATLNESLEAINKGLDEVIKAAETAVNAYNEAVANSMTSYRKNNSDWVDFKDFAAYDKKNDANALMNAAKEYLASTTALVNLDAAKVIVYTSDAVNSTALNGYYPLEVVGEVDTYVTVDTVYVADQEKYLSLNTVKLDKIAVDSNGNPLADDVKFDEEKGHTYVLVPTKGHNLTPALFKVNVNPLNVGKDEVEIYANAPLPTSTEQSSTFTTPKWFNQYKDVTGVQNNNYYENDVRIVIRTLAGAREASVMQKGEDDAVLENTTITFAEPLLASKINDGDIYFIINKNVREEANYNKYAVVDPITPNTCTYAKDAYVNVPATQWLVDKNNDTYELKNRDFNATYGLGANGKIYVVDEDNMIYTTNKRDTFQLVAADVEKEGHVGYKYISEEIQKISEFALSAVNYANMETPYYLTFNGNEDSILTTTSNKEEALALIPMIVDGKQVTEEYEMNDENLTKQYYQLIGKDGKDTLYLKKEVGSNELIVTTVAPKIDEDNNIDERIFLQFRSINDEANQYEVLLVSDWYANGEYWSQYKLSYNQDGEAVAVGAGTASAFVYDLVDNSSDIYKNFGFEGSTKVIISLNGDAESKVTKIGPFATVKRTGLDETIDADYSLIMDTAYVDHKDNIRYAYYITKPIVAADTAWNAEKFYMVSYVDSVTANRSNDTIKYSQDNLTRIGFVAAKRLGTDSLAITKAVGAAATDTLNVTEALGVTNATFAFAIDENNDEAYRIEVAPAKYVSYLNGILVEGAKEQAQLFNVNATDLTPTDNEEISVEAGVQVIGGKGAVTVQGAAGKTVTVYNFQGRALASTTLTSDNQTIAVPAGLVAVSVEGEPEAISVVVK